MSNTVVCVEYCCVCRNKIKYFATENAVIRYGTCHNNSSVVGNYRRQAHFVGLSCDAVRLRGLPFHSQGGVRVFLETKKCTLIFEEKKNCTLIFK